MYLIPIVLWTFISLQKPGECLEIETNKKSYVRYSDEGLYHTTLNAFESEWKETMLKGLKIQYLFLHIHQSFPLILLLRYDEGIKSQNHDHE